MMKKPMLLAGAAVNAIFSFLSALTEDIETARMFGTVALTLLWIGLAQK